VPNHSPGPQSTVGSGLLGRSFVEREPLLLRGSRYDSHVPLRFNAAVPTLYELLSGHRHWLFRSSIKRRRLCRRRNSTIFYASLRGGGSRRNHRPIVLGSVGHKSFLKKCRLLSRTILPSILLFIRIRVGDKNGKKRICIHRLHTGSRATLETKT